MGKRKPYQKKSFESTGENSDISANIYMSMLLSEAWISLTAAQKVLYLACKAQYYGQNNKPNPESGSGGKQNPHFYFNQSKWLKTKPQKNVFLGLALKSKKRRPGYKNYGLYSNRNSFYKDMAALIEKGFIACMYSGANHKQKSVYKFVDGWQNGLGRFEPENNHYTNHIRNKHKEAEKETAGEMVNL